MTLYDIYIITLEKKTKSKPFIKKSNLIIIKTNNDCITEKKTHKAKESQRVDSMEKTYT